MSENERIPGSPGCTKVGMLRRILLDTDVLCSIALTKDDNAVVFGQDIAFGGVFRCTMVSLAVGLTFAVLHLQRGL